MSALGLNAALKLLKPETPASLEAVNAWKAVKLFTDTLPTYVGRIHFLVACTGVLVTLSVAATFSRSVPSTRKSYTFKTAALTIATMGLTVLDSYRAFKYVRKFNLIPLRVISSLAESLNPPSSISKFTVTSWEGLEKIINKVPLIIKSIEELSAWTAGSAALALVTSVIIIRSQTIDPKNKPPRSSATEGLDEKVIISCLSLAIVTSIATIAYAKMYTPIH